MTRISFFHAKVVMINGFAFNNDKSLLIYFFRVKHQAKNDFLKDVESTESGKSECKEYICLTTLWANSADDTADIFLIFPENRI